VAYKSGHFPPLFQLLFSGKKIYAYYGFLGDRNFGDELVFEAARNLFAPHILLPFRRRMPVHLRLLAKIWGARISGLVIGGGTLIGPLWDREFFMGLVEEEKPIFVHGTGAHKDIRCAKDWTRILTGSVYGGVRGPQSVANLVSLQRALPIVGDAAFFMFEAKRTSSRSRDHSRKILINLGTHSEYDGKENAIRAMREFIDAQVRNDFDVVFLPFHEIDVVLGRELQASFPMIKMLDIPETYETALLHFEDAIFAVGERLHFIVMAILATCPFLSLNYAEKHKDLLLSLDLVLSGIAPNSVTSTVIHEHFENKELFDWDALSNRIQLLKGIQKKEADAFIRESSIRRDTKHQALVLS
jgi:polysaccharide pyruvyl transferase WcaK-like protein